MKKTVKKYCAASFALLSLFAFGGNAFAKKASKKADASQDQKQEEPAPSYESTQQYQANGKTENMLLPPENVESQSMLDIDPEYEALDRNLKEKKNKGSDEKESKEDKKIRKQREALERKQQKDKYTGWLYIPEKKLSIKKDVIRIDMRGDTGNFGLYAISENGKVIPLLSSYDNFMTTFFSVKIGEKEYRLNRENGVTSESRRTPYGAQMAYTISGQGQIVVDFSFMPSIVTSNRVDMVRVTVYAINLSRRTQSFAIKGVFDTVLGENSFTHFSTAAKGKIDTEKKFSSMEDDLWIQSAGEKAGLKFLLKGKGITDPLCVTLSNKDNLSSGQWIPSIQENKSFSSVVSFNNSAMAINYKPVYLDPLKSTAITFYVSVATDGDEPAGKAFLESLEKGKSAFSGVSSTRQVQTTTKAPKPKVLKPETIKSPYYQNLPVIATDDPKLLEPKPNVQYEEENDDSEGLVDYGAKQETPSVEQKKTVSLDSHVDRNYINRLLEQINALETSSEINHEELQRLNDELDIIIQKIGSGN